LIIHGSGEQRRDFVHVQDVVKAIAQLLRSPASGTWNVASGSSTSINELVALFETIHGEAASLELHAVRAGDVFQSSLSIDKIKRDLNWFPTIQLEEGLNQMSS
jgi:UDP-glucose 4-epimerase